MGTSTNTITTEGGAKIAKWVATFIKIRLQSILLELAYNWQKCKGSHMKYIVALWQLEQEWPACISVNMEERVCLPVCIIHTPYLVTTSPSSLLYMLHIVK